MSISEEQLRAAMADVGAEVTADSIPPLSLPVSQRESRRTARRAARRKPPAGRQRESRPRLLDAIAAAIAVIAVIAVAVLISGQAHGPAAGPRLSAQVPGFSLASAPPYFLALAGRAADGTGARPYAVIRSTVTGATQATIYPSRPYRAFVTVTAAADDRTFVLAAVTATVNPASLPSEPVRLFEARFSPAARSVTVSALPIPAMSYSSLESGLALSPDGTRLAMASYPGRGGEAGFGDTGITVYSLPGGAARSWHSPGFFGISSTDPAQTLSWSADNHTLAFDWTGIRTTGSGITCASTPGGLWLLNTATSGGSLLADSRLAAVGSNGLLSGDGTRVIASSVQVSLSLPACSDMRPASGGTSAATGRPPCDAEFEESSVLTGRIVAYLYCRPPGLAGVKAMLVGAAVLWSNAPGTVLIVAGTGTASVGVLSGSKLIPVPGAPPQSSPTPQIAF